jgi:hypothetical protein
MLAETLGMPAETLVKYLALVAALVLLVGSVVLRATTHNDWELKIGDAVIAFIPIVVWLVMTGQLKRTEIRQRGFHSSISGGCRHLDRRISGSAAGTESGCR